MGQQIQTCCTKRDDKSFDKDGNPIINSESTTAAWQTPSRDELETKAS